MMCRHTRNIRTSMVYALIVCGFSLWIPRAQACAISYEDLRDQISIADEKALLVWDKNAGVEHFIRSASFTTQNTKSRNFGFLVPTPTIPTLGAVKDEDDLFSNLAGQLRPKTEVRHRTDKKYTSLLLTLMRGGTFGDAIQNDYFGVSASAPPSSDYDSLEIIATQRVGGYDATILRANEAGALQRWLRKNGYQADKDTLDWLAPYITNHWAITAFKIAADAKIKSAYTGGVRLSFKTNRLFYPYREPAKARATKNSRSLRVFLLSNERMRGTIETPKKQLSWPGKLKYSAPLDAASLRDTVRLAKLPASVQQLHHLSIFDDFSSPRPGFGELYFERDPNQEQVTPAPFILWTTRHLKIPVDLIALGMLAVAIWLYRWLKSLRKPKLA